MKITVFLCFIVTLCLLFLLTSVCKSENLVGDITFWGPLGADVQSICFAPEQPDHIVIGTNAGRIFFSGDNAETWAPSTLPDYQAGRAVESIIPLFEKNHFLAAVRLEDETGRIWSSSDGGKSWIEYAQPDSFPAVRVLLAARDNELNVLFAGTTSGLWKSIDGGKQWIRIFVPSPSASIDSLALSSKEPKRLYAGTWRRAFMSRDMGNSFKPVWTNMAVDSHVFEFALHPDDNDILYAATCGWVYKSINQGESWAIRKNGLSDRRTRSLHISPLDPDTLYAGTPSGLFVSHDQGLKWEELSVFDQVINKIKTSPDNRFLFLCTKGEGILRSDDGGLTFKTKDKGLAASFISQVITSGTTLSTLLSQGNTRKILYIGNENTPLKNYIKIPEELGDILSLERFVPLGVTTPSYYFIGTYEGLYRLTMAENLVVDKADLPGPIKKIFVDVAHGNQLIVTTGKGLFLSDDDGENWIDISPKDYHGECLDVLFDEKTKLYFLATLIGVYRTNDEKFDWKYASYRLPKTKIPLLCLDPHRTGHLYAMTPKGLYKTNSAGREWGYIPATGFPDYPSFLLFHPHNRQILLTNDSKQGGLFISNSRGSNWKLVPGTSEFRIINATLIPRSENDTTTNILFMATYGHGLVSIPLERISE